MRDNSVLPSFLSSVPRGSGGGPNLLTNFVLRTGEIKSVVFPDNPLSISKIAPEYTVEVAHRDGFGSITHTLYTGVMPINGFGGAGDFTESTYRHASRNNEGSQVLLLCVSGDQNKAVILGGLPQASKDTSHHYTFEFNGAHVNVNSEGEISIVHRGPTNSDRSVKEQYEGYEGTKVVMNKRGNFEIVGHNEKQHIKIVHADPDNPKTDRSVQVQADQKLSLNSSSEIDVLSKDNIWVQSDEGAVIVKSEGVFVGDATDWWIKGSTYRDAESTANQNVAKQLQSAATQLATIAASLSAAAALNATPVVGGIMALPGLLAVATQLGTVGVSLGAAATSIDGFEAMADRFLSSKNKGD